jgi:hypothetical protein
MEALVYTFLLIGTLIVIFFAVFQRSSILKNKTILYGFKCSSNGSRKFSKRVQSCIDRICGNL